LPPWWTGGALALVTVTGRGVPFPRSVAFVRTCTATPSGVDGIPWVSDVDAGRHDRAKPTLGNLGRRQRGLAGWEQIALAGTNTRASW
jgi:hypothetical protein